MPPPEKQRQPAGATLLVLAILVVAGVVASQLVHLAAEVLEAVDEGDGVAVWDRPLLDWVVKHRTSGLTSAMLWFTHSGGPIWQPVIVAGVALLLWWRWRDPTPAILLAITEVGAVLISMGAKQVVDRVRPEVAEAVVPYETSPSFPSGHTLQAFAAATVVAYLLIRHGWRSPRWQRVLIGVTALAYASAMGVSRVYLGYHWLTDVMAAAFLGIAWAVVVLAAHRLWRALRRGRSRPADPGS